MTYEKPEIRKEGELKTEAQTQIRSQSIIGTPDIP
jgi:hypothetical protein